MKTSDFAPRTSFMVSKLAGEGRENLRGIEVGCDTGAHCESLLTYTNTSFLYLVDLFNNEWCEGYCTGRLARWQHKIKIYKTTSSSAAARFKNNIFDYIYIDIAHDEKTVTESLNDWWPLLRSGGIMGYRNYSTCKAAIDKFCVGKKYEVDSYHNEIVIFK